MKYPVLIDVDEDGIFIAQVPSLPGCISQGTTRDEVLQNAKEAIDAYLDSVRAHGDRIPTSAARADSF